MARRYGDPVFVRPDGEGEATGEPPASFLWRGRLYVVRSVLGHWRERRSWWTEAAARAVHGAQSQDGSRDESSEESRDEVPAPGTRLALSDEREVWRVEAGAGRAAGLGVYDLRCDSGAESGRSWSLVRVGD